MLDGTRVRLRAMAREDLPALWEMQNDLEVESRASDQRPLPTTLEEMQARYDARAAQPDQGVVRFTVEADGEVVGSCQLHTFDDFSQSCHLGISIRRDRWGQGFGTDTVKVLLDYAFTHLNIRKVCLEVLAHDERATSAYRRAGFVEEGRFREQTWHHGEYVDVLRMAVLRSDWGGPAEVSPTG